MLIVRRHIRYFSCSILWILLATTAYTQVEQNRATHWHFGNQKGFDFSSGEPKQVENSQIDAVESCCTMSDLNGNLLFYTNGGGREDGESFGGIWNGKHELMEGGDLGTTLGGGQSGFQGCLTVPKPANPNLYYLFTVDHIETLAFKDSQFPIGKGLNYFEIDVAANSGQGKVENGETLINPCFEYISGTLHGNCTDYWVIAQTSHHYIERSADVADTFYVFQITEEGIQSPVKVPMIEGQSDFRDEYGPMKISPDGKRLICGLFIYDFDNLTGNIDNPISLTPFIQDPTASLAFSPNGNFLYNFQLNSLSDTTTAFEYVAYQYDLGANPIVSSEVILGTVPLSLTSRGRVGTPQIAPDGKIYTPFWMGNPFKKIAVTRLDFPDKKGETAAFTFDVEELSEGMNQRFLRFGNFMDYIFIEKEEKTFREQIIPLEVNCEDQSEVVLKGPPNQSTYVWSENGITDTLAVTESGKYWVNYAEGCAEGADTFLLTIFNDQFDVSLPEDIVFLCDNERIMLRPDNLTQQQLIWQDSTLANEYETDKAGIYTVVAKQGLCRASDSTEVVLLEKPLLELGRDTIICGRKSFILTSQFSPYNWYEWQDGQSTNEVEVNAPGRYELRIGNECGEVSDAIEVSNCPDCELYIPNVFSPNDDNQNDQFKAYYNSQCELSNFRMQIMDKWGNRIAELKSFEESWDGNHQQQRSLEGVYWYVASYIVNWPDGRQESKVQSGEVTLVR